MENKIIYDHREEPSGVPDELKKLGSSLRRVNNLEVCDYIINRFGIERKTDEDYVSSLFDGRLNKQLTQMSKYFIHSLVIIEGNLERVIISRNINRRSVYSSIAGLMTRRYPDGKQGVISCIQTLTHFDTALLIYYIWKKYENTDQPIRLPSLQPITWSNNDWSLALLSAIPGVGPVKGKSLLEQTKTLEKLFLLATQKPEKLVAINGIGQKTVETIKNILKSEYK